MTRYALLQRILHWLIALLLVCTLSIGMIFGILRFDGTMEAFGGPITNALYEYHKTMGLIILALMLVRLFARFEFGKPPHGDTIAPWERIASSIVQYLLYVALLIQPVLGWLGTDAATFPVEFFNWDLPQVIPKSKKMAAFGVLVYQVHYVVGWSILVLLVLHIGGGLKHRFIDRNQVMRRMSLF